MEKDFDKWNNQKKVIHNRGENKFYHPRDIWWCRLGLNVGYKYRIPIGLIEGKEATVILSQIKVVDTKRFSEKIGVLNKEIFSNIQKHIRDFF